MYDAQIGRFFTEDRFAEKYISLTPYQYGANNPILITDMNGDSLIVTSENKGFENIVNNGLGGLYTMQQNETGTYSLVSTGVNGPLSEKQQAFYDNLNSVLTSANTVSILAVANSESVDIGQYPTQTIDVGDVAKFNSISSSNSTGSTAEGLLIHEVVEQNLLQKSGVNLNDEKAMRARFDKDHGAAMLVEDSVNGNVRQKNMERMDRGNGPFSKTYTKYFKERNGSYTIESTTNGTKEMKVVKQYQK
jgi:hypothetical protein